jgi:predicted acylesterase/phospholipase RssA
MVASQQSPRRLGMALSGGGLRAAFFHVGVLAQMARLGLLRHVEVLSTVSGGSIIGALYYLHVKRLLEEKPDAAITDQDYQALVARIEVDFFAAVKQNVRVRSLLNPWKLLKTCLPTYSRCDHLGYLFDQFFYRPAVGSSRTSPIQMRELPIRPKGGPDEFHPTRDNAARSAKVPMLLINATALNTGHNWRFEAVRMGEPQRQSAVAEEIDKMVRLRRPTSYDDITPRQQDFELGLAVAASSCVPALFPPLAISGLYADGIRVQLVDGGVHDNQGIQGLLDMECTHFVVSDASEQLDEEPAPGTEVVPVLDRSAAVLQNRVREEQLFRLLERDGLPTAFMHLRKGLSAEAIAWLDRNGQPAAAPQTERVARADFGVPKAVQEALSHIRTDLDAFSEVEAYSLMLDAYLMSDAELHNLGKLVRPAPADQTHRWRFLQVEPWLRNPTPRYQRRLDVAHDRQFKLFRLKWPISMLLVAALLVLLGWLMVEFPIVRTVEGGLTTPVPVGVPVLVLLGLALVAVSELITPPRFPAWFWLPLRVGIRFVVSAVVALFASPVSAVQLYVLHPLFLWEGRIKRLGRPPGPGG